MTFGTTVLRAPWSDFDRPKGLFQGSKRNTRVSGSWVLERYGIYIYDALYVRRRSRWALCTHFRIQRKFLGGVSTWKGNKKNNLWACSPGKYTSQVHFCCEIWEMVKTANLGIADLGVLEAWDRSGMIQASILAGLECHRTIGAVQTRIPEIVNRDCQNSLYSFSLVNALRGLHALQGWF